MNDVPTVSIKPDKNFSLRAPKGNVYKFQIYTAYNKGSLSSIPRDHEIILINPLNSYSPNKNKSPKNPNDFTTKNFHPVSKTLAEIINNCAGNNNQKSRNLSSSSKNFLNDNSHPNFFFSSEARRFDIKKELQDKYSPGPGEYLSRNKKKTMGFANTYQSVFLPHRNFSLVKHKKHSPGPADYSPFERYKPKLGSFSTADLKIGSVLNQYDEELNDVGPGSYFKSPINELKELKQKSKNDKNSDIKNTHMFVNNNNFMANTTKKNRMDILLQKYIDIDKKKEFEVPGVGKYYIRRDFSSENKERNNNKKKTMYFNMIDQELKNTLRQIQKENEYSENDENKDNEDQSHTTRKYFKSDYWNGVKSQKKITSPFMSKTKKIVMYDNIINQHNPGPCYYNQDLWQISAFCPKKKFFY